MTFMRYLIPIRAAVEASCSSCSSVLLLDSVRLSFFARSAANMADCFSPASNKSANHIANYVSQQR